jgi:AraC-like DNA-binding protein
MAVPALPASAPPAHPDAAKALRLSTQDQPRRERHGWLREVIGREYANVEVVPPADGSLFNEMTIFPWDGLRLSVIRSNALGIERLPRDPYRISQDAYLAVVLLGGDYLLQQDGREVFLRPGDMALYDATRPHRLHCPRSFAKLIVSIPRPALRERVAGIEHCTALRIPGDDGIGAVVSNFVRSAARNAASLSAQEFTALAEPALDLLTLAATAVRPADFQLSRSRSLSLHRIKEFVERHLAEADLDAARVAAGAGLSSRYINDLFKDEDTSLMRHVWQRRLEHCRRDLRDPAHAGHRLSDIAFRWGFNDLSHFSRAFRLRFGCSPRDYRQSDDCKEPSP